MSIASGKFKVILFGLSKALPLAAKFYPAYAERLTGGYYLDIEPDFGQLAREQRLERLDGDLLHYSYRSISDHLRTIDSFTTIAAREKHAAGRRAGGWTVMDGAPNPTPTSIHKEWDHDHDGRHRRRLRRY